jgi:hypothetical protein
MLAGHGQNQVGLGDVGVSDEMAAVLDDVQSIASHH